MEIVRILCLAILIPVNVWAIFQVTKFYNTVRTQFNIQKTFLLIAILFAYKSYSQTSNQVVIEFNPSKTYQIIDNFGASDAWSCQFVGNWPDEKKNAIADLLFSTDTLSDGSPKGIGLSLWRYNIGAGSANQANSGIRDEWHRAASFINDSNEASTRINAQNWFLLAAKKRGVKQFLGFFNSPPVYLTANRKAFASKGITNINTENYKDFASYAVEAIKKTKQSTGILFNYISPVNEPQWDWSDDKQEGSPYSNVEISKLVKVFNNELIRNKLSTKIIVPEAADIKYLLSNSDKPAKDNQVHTFFNPTSSQYIGSLSSVEKTIAYHSYFSTSPFANATAIRSKVHQSISAIKGLKLWQTEYCVLGENAGEINGNGRDLGMNAALYAAKVIYEDLVYANSSAWQWWLAVSPYNYKDGLIYADKNKTDGSYYPSKILWALGNYSFFVRPGMKRIETSITATDLFVSAFKDGKKNVIVIINTSDQQKTISFKKQNTSAISNFIAYVTDNSNDLKKSFVTKNEFTLPAKSVVSVIIN